jgi:hypothetical protein
MNNTKTKFFFLLGAMLFIIACSRPSAEVITAPPLPLSGFKNIKIDSSTTFIGPCEPSICINPTNPDNIVAGSVLHWVYVSNDGGKTWSKDILKSSSGVYGDPVIRSDFKGNIYYSHLSNPTGKAWQDEEFLDRIVIQKSENGGKTWNDGSFTRPNNPKDQDKQWMAVDPNDNTLYMTWTEFDKYDSKDPKDKSRILFTKSTDRGESWTDPLPISQKEGNCLDGDQTTEGAVPAVSHDGNLYVAWCYDEKIYFDKSLDQGETWLSEDVVVSDQPGGWDYKIPGITRCNGMTITEVDQSNGPHQGTIYINWSDQRNGENDTDIWLAKSTNQGKSWSAPKRVNDDPAGKHQFFTWMDVDPITGYIYIVFYDRRDDLEDTNSTEVYLAYSTDGGESFTNTKISESPFTPNPAVFFGDYNDISAYNGVVRPIWTRQEGMVLSVWTALVNVKI